MAPITMYPFVVNINSQLALLIRFFRDKKAIDEKNAISLTNLDWGEMGIFNGPNSGNWKSYQNFIKSTNEGKYWLDIDALELYRQSQKDNIRKFYAILGTVVSTCGLIGVPIFLIDSELNTVGNWIASLFLVGFGIFIIYLRNSIANKWIS